MTFYFNPKEIIKRRTIRSEGLKRRTDFRNCTTCKHYVECPKFDIKSFDYICNQFESLPYLASEEDYLGMFGRDVIQTELAEEAQALSNIELMINRAIKDQEQGIISDFVLEDQDIPQAKNIIDFYFNPDFETKNKPFPKQIEILTDLFSEVCYNPKCTDVAYAECVPIDVTIDQLQERVTYLEHGVCPKCKETRIDMWNKYGKRKAKTMAGCIGQRCIVGSSRVLTEDGIIKIENLDNGKYGFSDYTGPNLVSEDGSILTASKFFKAKKETVCRVLLNNGHEIIGTFDHPIYTANGFTKIKDLTLNTDIPVHVGQNSWGKNRLNLTAIASKVEQEIDERISKSKTNNKNLLSKTTVLNTGLLDEDFATLLGLWTAEGSIGKGTIFLANTDQTVLDFAQSQFKRLYPDVPYKYGSRNIAINSTHAQTHFKHLMQQFNLSNKKFIPDHILQAPKDIVCAYLRGYFEGDGDVIIRRANGQHMIEVSTKSKTMALDVSACLNNLGIMHHIRRKTNRYKYKDGRIIFKTYMIQIYNPRAVKLYKENIGFMTTRKINLLTDLITIHNSRVNLGNVDWFDKYPQFVKNEMIKIIKKYSIRIDKNLVRSGFTRQKLQNLKIINNLPLELTEFIQKYDNSNVYWTKIKDIRVEKRPQKTYDFHVPKLHKFMANGLIQSNSGKDWTMGFGFAYQDHLLLKLRDPGKAYGLGSKSMLYKTFTAIDFGQALKATFLPYVDFIENSKWFKQYHQMLDHSAKKHGKKLYNIGKEAITWNYHGLASLVQSPDVRGLRGVARVGYSITEVAWFYSKTKNAVKLDIEGIMEALINSTANVLAGWNRNIERGNFNVPPPIEMLASSPRSKKDQIMSLLKEAKKDKSIVAKHYSTYQFNPTIKEGDLDSFKRNPDKYRTSILCLPADAVSAFIPDKRLLLNCINNNRPNGVITKNIITESGSRARLTSVFIKPLLKNVDTKSPKVMFLDGGHKNNSFALCVAHVVTDENKGREVNYTVVDILLEVIPSDSRPADYAHILEEVIIPICDTYNVQYVVADRYAGTIYHLQELQKIDIEANVRSIKYADFLRFKQGLFEATLDLPRLEVDDPKKIFDLGQNNYPISFNGKPVSHLIQQAVTVEDLMGKKVDKGEGFTDDLFYALVGAYTICNDEELREQFLGGSTEIFNDQVLGVSVNYSGVKQSVEVSGGASINSDYDIGVKIGYRDVGI